MIMQDYDLRHDIILLLILIVLYSFSTAKNYNDVWQRLFFCFEKYDKKNAQAFLKDLSSLSTYGKGGLHEFKSILHNIH